MTEIETKISTGDADPHFYLCGRMIGMNKLVLSGAWNLKEKLLAREEESVHAIEGEAELLASRLTEVGGLVKEPALQVEEAAPTGLEDGLSGSKEAAALVVSPPNILAGNPSFKLGLKRRFGFGTEADGFGFSGDGPAGTDLVLKKPKSSFHSGELVEVPVWFRSISLKKSPKKRGRPRGSHNKKRTVNGDLELSDSMTLNSEGANAETGLESEAGEE
ncbi:hypothetical protein ACLB2K_008258 [Fragaria x ananassa]